MPSGNLAVEPEADDLRDEHGGRLAKHGRFRLDAADAPAEHRQPVDHGRMAVGADQRVGKGVFNGLALLLDLLGPHRAREIFEIHLVADAGAGRHDAEIVESALAPFEKGVALAIAVIFERHILLEGFRIGEEVDHHGMVDDEIDGRQRIDLLRIAAQIAHRIAHRGKVDDGRHAGEVLHEHACRPVGDLVLGLAAIGEPVGEIDDAFPGDGAAVLMTQEIFEQHFQRIGKRGNSGQSVLLGGLQAEIGIGLGAHLQSLAAFEGIEGRRGHSCSLVQIGPGGLPSI